MFPVSVSTEPIKIFIVVLGSEDAVCKTPKELIYKKVSVLFGNNLDWEENSI
jgi:hypothetical protein